MASVGVGSDSTALASPVVALFVHSGELFHPTPFTTGPWRADAQHGGPPAALLTRSVERLLDQHEVLSRVSVDLLAPVPLVPLSISATRTAVSRRVTHFHGSLQADGLTVATVRALALRRTELPPPGWTPDETAPTLPSPDIAKRAPSFVSAVPISYHRDAVEHRTTHGIFGEVGEATSWVRLIEPLVEGEDTSTWCRVLAAADFGSGISSIYDFGGDVGLVNADLMVSLARPARGEWIRLSSVSRVNDQGTGLAVTQLADQTGYIGVATQSLLGLHLV